MSKAHRLVYHSTLGWTAIRRKKKNHEGFEVDLCMPQPSSLHRAPCTLHTTPCTLHPAPYTLHPTPCTLHPNLDNRGRCNDECFWVSGLWFQPAKRDQIAFSRFLICTGARRNPGIYGTHQGIKKNDVVANFGDLT